MERLKTLHELIQIAEAADPRLKKLGIRSESRSEQFPYKFSYMCGSDRFNSEFSEQEVRKLMEDPHLDSAIRDAFTVKIAMKS